MSDVNRPNNSLPHKREVWIDILKGIAIILVVVGHNIIYDPYRPIVNFIYSFHMPLFFMVAGFVFSPKPSKTYLARSTRRLILPLIVFCILIGLPGAIKWCLTFPDIKIDGLFKVIKSMYTGAIMATGGVYTVTWFVTVLWFSTNLFNYIASRQMTAWLLIPLLALGYLMSYLPADLPFRITVVPMAMAYIWIGFLMGQNLEMLKNINKCIYILIGGVSCIIVFLLGDEYRVDMKHSIFGIPLISFLFSVSTSVVVGILAMSIASHQYFAKMLSLLGEASMEIMYLHLPTREYLVRMQNETSHIIASIILGIIIPLIFFLVTKKSSLLRQLFLGR